MQELCHLLGAHKTRTTPYHPASDGLVEHFNRTLLMMLAMFAGEHRDDWDDLLSAVMMAVQHYQKTQPPPPLLYPSNAPGDSIFN